VTAHARVVRHARAGAVPAYATSVVVVAVLLAQYVAVSPIRGAPSTFPQRGAVGAHDISEMRRINPPSGVLEIDKPTVLRNAVVVGGIDVNANLTMRNVLVASDGRWWGNVVVRSGARLTAENCTIRPSGAASNPARRQDGVLQMAGGRVTIRRCDISGTSKGALVGTGARIEDSWLHDFAPSTDPATGQPVHKEAVMVLGGSDIRIIRCRCEANNPDPYDPSSNPHGFDAATQTAAITLQPWSPIRDLEIRDSFLQGGYYALRIESHAGGTIHGLRVEDTVFGPPRAGFYTYDSGARIAAWRGNVEGNRDGDPTGRVVPAPTADTRP
jgi:hypothetical protein